MKKNRWWELFLLGGVVCGLAGTPLHGAGGDSPSLDSFDLNQVTVDIVPLSSTTVEIEEDVLFEVTLQNNGDSPVKIELWFTVDLTGIDHEKMVSIPYLSKDSPMDGYLLEQEEVILQLRARPLENIPLGPYTFFAKIGFNGDNYVRSSSYFQGTIVHSNINDWRPGRSDDWIVTSVWAVNEAGSEFLAGAGRSLPRTVNMIQNYPNPFNPSTNLTFEVKPVEDTNTPVELAIYNVHGRLIRTLMNDRLSAGVYTVRWDGKDNRGSTVDSGVYFFKLQSGNEVSLKKGIMTK